MPASICDRTSTRNPASAPGDSRRLPSVLLIGPSLRIMGGQAVMADRILRALREDGVRIDFLPIDPLLPAGLRWTRRVKFLRTVTTSVFYWASLLRTVRHYDVVHLFSAAYLSFWISQSPAILIAWWFRRPLILNYRSGEAEDHLRRGGWLLSRTLRLPQRIVVPSGYLVEVFARAGFRASAIANVVDERVARYRHRERAHPRVLVPRALEPLYNVACALRAFAILQSRHPHSHLTILGEGSQSRSLQRLACQLGLRHVRFLGRVERAEMAGLYDRHDILLNTSSIDNMPVSLLEGFAAGLPIVSTRAGGIPHVIRDGHSGYLVDVNDHEAAARALLRLTEHSDEVARLSRIGRQESEKYRWPCVSEQWCRLYREVWRAESVAVPTG
jgi:glycosyltransferase involved in cell wall biosynthesis